ncbi:hypothetical protein BS78_09G179700 [Paspalum vaginatum]|nr:hypothetical protein BS78_09G179700 [Paspalum vaginatum]
MFCLIPSPALFKFISSSVETEQPNRGTGNQSSRFLFLSLVVRFPFPSNRSFQGPIKPQVMIKWSGMCSTLATWEYLESLKESFPRAPAWGQAGSCPGRGVSAQYLKHMMILLWTVRQEAQADAAARWFQAQTGYERECVGSTRMPVKMVYKYWRAERREA